MSLVADEVAQVAVLHVGQDDQRRALGREADPQQGEHVGVAEVLHDDALLQELGHLLQVSDACKQQEMKKRVEGKLRDFWTLRRDSDSDSLWFMDRHIN